MSVRLETIETARLRYERLRRDHAADVGRLLLDPQVARTLWPHLQPPTWADVIASLSAGCAHWDRHGFGLWLIRDRATGEMVGRGGLQSTLVDDIEEVEVGWSIMPERWGEGLATELALMSVDVAFKDLALREIVAFTLPDNVASRRVMEKAGLHYEREIVRVGLPHVLYRLRRAPVKRTLGDFPSPWRKISHAQPW